MIDHHWLPHKVAAGVVKIHALLGLLQQLAGLFLHMGDVFEYGVGLGELRRKEQTSEGLVT